MKNSCSARRLAFLPKPFSHYALLILLLGFSTMPLSADTVFSSGPERVSLLELYTSEGCSSCPPADRWLSGLKQQPGLWNQFVPIAFHVDYWDYIGWKDRFAQPEFGERQRNFAREGAARAVYTPGMLLDGKDWRDWTDDRAPPGQNSLAGELHVELKDDQVRVRFQPSQPMHTKKLYINMAWLGSGYETQVKAGENRGRRLSHDFIVLRNSRTRLEADQESYVASIKRPADLAEAPRYALAVWVSNQSSLAPLQATGGWLEAAKPGMTH